MNDLAEKHAQGVTRCDECDTLTVCRRPYATGLHEINVCIECFGLQASASWDDFPLAPAEQAVIDAIREALKEQARRIEKLEKWARLGEAVMEAWPESGDIDGFMLQDMAVKAGVLVEVPGGFDPEQHDDTVGYGAEPGDPWFTIINTAFPERAREDGEAL